MLQQRALTGGSERKDPSYRVDTKTLAAITGRNAEHAVMMHELSGRKWP